MGRGAEWRRDRASAIVSGVEKEFNVQLAVIQAAAWILSIGLHEAGHAYTANRLGDPTPGMFGRLTLNPFAHLKPVVTAIILPLIFIISQQGLLGGASTPINPSYFRKPLRDRVIVALAGPTVNILLLLLFSGAFLALPASVLAEGSIYLRLLKYFVSLNAFLILFNLLPVPGLDGGDVIRYFLGPSIREKFDAMRQYGIIIAIVVLSLPHVGGYYFYPVRWYMLQVFGTTLI